jgi:hypothetical protein
VNRTTDNSGFQGNIVYKSPNFMHYEPRYADDGWQWYGLKEFWVSREGREEN